MNVWYVARELAGLPGLPGTVRGVLDVAQRRGWQSRQRVGRGGGCEFHLDSFPPDTQAYLREQAGEPAAPPPESLPATIPNPAGVPTLFAAVQSTENLPDLLSPAVVADHQAVRERYERTEDERRKLKAEGSAKFSGLRPDSDKRQRAKARQWLITAANQIVRDERLTKAAGRVALCARVNGGELALPAHVAPWLPQRAGVQQITEPTLHRWILAYEAGGIWALTDGYGTRDGHTKIAGDQGLYRAVLGRMLADPHATARDIHAWLHTREGLQVPPLRSLQRFREQWIADNYDTWLFMSAPGKWKNKHQVAFGSHHERVVRLNQVWEMDSTPGDWLLTDGVRHQVLGCIDLYSRRLALRVSRTSTGYAVGQCFRQATLAWGVPEVVRTDNGKDYISDYFSSVLTDLEITQELCIPFASEEKGTVERVLKTMAYGLSKLLPGFIGHNVAEAQVIRERRTFAQRIMTPGEVVAVAMSADDLQRALNEWVEHIYSQDPHSGEGMEGLCPVAKAARWTGEVRRVDPHALAALLLPVAGVRTIATIGKSQGIGKKGIRWQHRWYIHADLAEHVGKAVFCRVDEADLGRLYVYVDDAFLCIAENPAMTGISQAEVAAVAKAKQKKAMTAHTKELRRIKKEVGTNAAQEVLRARAEASGKLIEFPRAGTPYSTPALEAGAAAVAAQAPRVAREETPEEAAGRTHLAARIAARAQAAARVPETDQERYLRWVRMEAEIAAGVTFTHDLMAWWTDYPNTAEGKVQKKMAQVYPKLYAVGAHPGVS